jgi:hypothetical protein
MGGQQPQHRPAGRCRSVCVRARWNRRPPRARERAASTVNASFRRPIGRSAGRSSLPHSSPPAPTTTQRERPAKRRSMRCSASCPKRICSTAPTSGPRDTVRLLSRLTMLRVESNGNPRRLHRAGAQRIAGAPCHKAGQIRLARNHFRRRVPIRILRRQGANIGWI